MEKRGKELRGEKRRIRGEEMRGEEERRGAKEEKEEESVTMTRQGKRVGNMV